MTLAYADEHNASGARLSPQEPRSHCQVKWSGQEGPEYDLNACFIAAAPPRRPRAAAPPASPRSTRPTSQPAPGGRRQPRGSRRAARSGCGRGSSGRLQRKAGCVSEGRRQFLEKAPHVPMWPSLGCHKTTVPAAPWQSTCGRHEKRRVKHAQPALGSDLARAAREWCTRRLCPAGSRRAPRRGPRSCCRCLPAHDPHTIRQSSFVARLQVAGRNRQGWARLSAPQSV